jgi:hypothetical protein
MNIKKMMIVTLVVLAMTTAVFSQGRGRGICYRQIQVQTPVVIEGKIIKIGTFDYGRGRYGEGLHLFVLNNGQESEIHLGPQTWLNNQGLDLKQGDKVKIKVYKGTLYNGNPALFAAEVTGPKGGKSIMLRDANGFPMWRQSLRGGKGRGLNRGARQGQGRGGWYNR